MSAKYRDQVVLYTVQLKTGLLMYCLEAQRLWALVPTHGLEWVKRMKQAPFPVKLSLVLFLINDNNEREQICRIVAGTASHGCILKPVRKTLVWCEFGHPPVITTASCILYGGHVWKQNEHLRNSTSSTNAYRYTVKQGGF